MGLGGEAARGEAPSILLKTRHYHISPNFLYKSHYYHIAHYFHLSPRRLAFSGTHLAFSDYLLVFSLSLSGSYLEFELILMLLQRFLDV